MRDIISSFIPPNRNGQADSGGSDCATPRGAQECGFTARLGAEWGGSAQDEHLPNLACLLLTATLEGRLYATPSAAEDTEAPRERPRSHPQCLTKPNSSQDHPTAESEPGTITLVHGPQSPESLAGRSHQGCVASRALLCT